MDNKFTIVHVADGGVLVDSSDWSCSRFNRASRFYDGGKGGYAYPGENGPQYLPTTSFMPSRTPNCGNCGSNQYMLPYDGRFNVCIACNNQKKDEGVRRPMMTSGPQAAISSKGLIVEKISRETTSMLHSPQRKARLEANKMVLYHQTEREVALAIVHDQNMFRGSGGLGGAAIYFATSPEHTQHKTANHFGAILKATVLLGRVKTIAKTGDSGMNLTQLTEEGYDSVLIPRDNGYEYVIYHPDQVQNIQIHY